MVPAAGFDCSEIGSGTNFRSQVLTFVSSRGTPPIYSQYLDIDATAGRELSPARSSRTYQRVTRGYPCEPGPIVLPIERDGRMHTYVYPLRLLQLAPATRIHGVSIQVRDQVGMPEQGAVTINGVRLLKARRPFPPPLCPGASRT